MDYKEMYAKATAKAWKSPAFKQKLLNNPSAAFKELGYNIPAGTNIEVVEASANVVHFVLPPSPANLNQLSDKELQKLAAAGCYNTCEFGTHQTL